MKLTFGIIVLNGDFLLKQVLESIYPFAHKICIAEGPVQYFVDKGIMASTDNTLDIIHSFPDPQHKINFKRGQYKEKDENVQAFRETLERTNKLRAIKLCVEKWELQNFTAEPFPFSPRKDTHKLIDWLWNEILTIYEGESIVPNE